MVEFNFKDKYSFDDLVEIMAILRAPGGCPWDAEQTHESIKKSFIEETYEVIEAINKKDKDLLCEELGDAMLQVVFHAQMEREIGSFDINDVCDGICKKLIERHPHVFASVKVNGSDEVLDNWDTIKRKSKGQKTQGSSMEKIPKELPALMRAQKIQSKAKKDGFDWSEIDGAYDALYSEIEELKVAVKSQNIDDITDEMGDVLFSAVNISRFLDVDAEEALTASNDKFISRYLIVEKLAKERNINMKETSIEELDKLWNEAKGMTK
ncbi:MAG: nucleoside triphosphate pyrophosphohydrolase [Faecalibacterium sp.]|nr:nucleoside triphosphate pyrophosphohydrolase [Ruminococcus sp.]MCM1391408.1 nucleoside triphosphate pyrophosphohydrolase [Ruminococcus sp.]MCM1486675.1 nucleoside triphosphate pyrophosphohydrolase [Faecalibacterium sp.]